MVLMATDLPEPGGAGDEQMRHLGELGDDRLAADGLAEAQRQLELRGCSKSSEPISSRK